MGTIRTAESIQGRFDGSIREVSVLIVETDLERLADSMLRYFTNSVIHEHLENLLGIRCPRRDGSITMQKPNPQPEPSMYPVEWSWRRAAGILLTVMSSMVSG